MQEIYEVKKIAADVYLINESNMACCYLFVGTQRALLVDTGVGLDDLKGLVESITSLPYDVAATHGHVDHLGGRGQFSKIWLHEADHNMVGEITPAYRRGFLMTQVWGTGSRRELFGRIQPGEAEPELLTLDDGHVFELGGKSIRVIHAPGHTRGSVYFFDAADRLILTGDNTSPLVLLCLPNSATLPEYVQSVELLLAMRGAYQAVYSGHDRQAVPETRLRCMLKNAREAQAKSKRQLPGVHIRQINNCPLVYRT